MSISHTALLALLLAACGNNGTSNTTDAGSAMDAASDLAFERDAATSPDAASHPTAACTTPDVTIKHTGTAANAAQYVVLDPTKYPEALCNDGSPASYVITPGSGSAASRWVVLLGGGSDCIDQASCKARAAATPELVSSNGFQMSALTNEGIRSTDASLNPDFYDATQVAARYCSSDAWSGQKTGTGPFNASDITTWNFRGHAIVAAIFADLAANHGFSSATEVLLTGDSAGGVGVFVNANDVATLVPSGARYVALSDAGFGNDVNNFSATGAAPNYDNPTATPYEQQNYETGLLTWNGRGDKFCDAAATTAMEKLYCYDAQALLAEGGPLTMPMLVTVSQKDIVQLSSDGIPADHLKSNMLTTAEAGYVAYFSSNMKAHLETVNSTVSIFSPNVVLHVEESVAAAFNAPYTFPGGQLTYQQATSAWYKSPCTPQRNLAD